MVGFASRSWRVGLCNGGFCKFQVGGWGLCSLVGQALQVSGGWGTVGFASFRNCWRVEALQSPRGHSQLCKFQELLEGGGGSAVLSGGHGVLCKSRGVGHGGLRLLEGGGSAVLGVGMVCSVCLGDGGLCKSQVVSEGLVGSASFRGVGGWGSAVSWGRLCKSRGHGRRLVGALQPWGRARWALQGIVGGWGGGHGLLCKSRGGHGRRRGMVSSDAHGGFCNAHLPLSRCSCEKIAPGFWHSWHTGTLP